MGKKHKKSKLEKTKSHYYQNYLKWKSVYCPALQKDVLFTNWGLQHLSEEKKRTKKEKIERMKLLPLAKKLLEMTTTKQGKRFQNYHDIYEFVSLMDGVKIKVLVIEYKKQYYFYSIFKV